MVDANYKIPESGISQEHAVGEETRYEVVTKMSKWSPLQQRSGQPVGRWMLLTLNTVKSLSICGSEARIFAHMTLRRSNVRHHKSDTRVQHSVENVRIWMREWTRGSEHAVQCCSARFRPPDSKTLRARGPLTGQANACQSHRNYQQNQVMADYISL